MEKEIQTDKTWISPFKKQCFVVLGVCLNMQAHGLVMGFTAILIPQLRLPESPIPIDNNSGSWIASIVGFTLVAGNFIVPSIMSRFGRQKANLLSIIPLLAGWFCILTANSVTALIIGRCLQGIAMGMSATIGPVLVGEYSSPKNRGAFLTSISLTIAAGVLAVHTMGIYFTWQTTALVCSFIAFTDLLIVFFSPESPSFLADKGRYDECRKNFRWLRGESENEELEQMIQAAVVVREAKMDVGVRNKSFCQRINAFFVYFGSTIKKREFYKPIFIMVHIYTLGQWSGGNVLVAYALDIFHYVIGPDVNVALMVITMDVQRIISNACAVYVIKKVKRRTMLLGTVSINLFAMLSTAAYTYFKSRDMLPFDHPLIGVFLIHIHMFTIATGTVPMPFIIAGELFPLQYRSLAGGLSVLSVSSNLFITVKTVPYLFKAIGIYGTYLLYCGVVSYCLFVALKFLPETKDRTLQDIEDEFRGRPMSVEESKATKSLTASMILHNKDRRFSTPAV